VNILHETAEPARVHSTFIQNRLAGEAVQGAPNNIPTDQPLYKPTFGHNLPSDNLYGGGNASSNAELNSILETIAATKLLPTNTTTTTTTNSAAAVAMTTTTTTSNSAFHKPTDNADLLDDEFFKSLAMDTKKPAAAAASKLAPVSSTANSFQDYDSSANK
jgi:hypothetical protein